MKKILIVPFMLFSLSAFAEKAFVTRVIDGDTIHVNIFKDNVRLSGIDTLESLSDKEIAKIKKKFDNDLEKYIQMHPKNRKFQKVLEQAQELRMTPQEVVEWGRAAKDYVKSMIKPGDEVNLEYDYKKLDKYRRPLAYVYLKDGRMLNKLIGSQGLCLLYTGDKRIQFYRDFEEIIGQSRSEKKGIFKNS